MINSLKVSGDWAFINCALQLANSKEVDWKKAGLIKAPVSDFVENNAVGLLKRYSTGQWTGVCR